MALFLRARKMTDSPNQKHRDHVDQVMNEKIPMICSDGLLKRRVKVQVLQKSPTSQPRHQFKRAKVKTSRHRRTLDLLATSRHQS